MYEIEYQFTPGSTVYFVNRFTHKIAKGDVLNVHLGSYTNLDKSIETVVKYSIKEESIPAVFKIDETDVFATYELAAAKLFS